MTFFWATICNRFWERREASLAYQWGSYAVTARHTLEFGKRANLKGEMKTSPRHWESRNVLLAHETEAEKCCFCSCEYGILSLFMYCDDHFNECTGIQLAEPGDIFDASSSWKCLLPVILRSVVVNFMNQMYRKAAEVLTEWENHELVMHHDNSLALKRFFFEAFDAYIVLFYLAIYERNTHLLRLELVGAMSADTFRRMLTESLIPYALQKISAEKAIAQRRKTMTHA